MTGMFSGLTPSAVYEIHVYTYGDLYGGTFSKVGTKTFVLGKAYASLMGNALFKREVDADKDAGMTGLWDLDTSVVGRTIALRMVASAAGKAVNPDQGTPTLAGVVGILRTATEENADASKVGIVRWG